MTMNNFVIFLCFIACCSYCVDSTPVEAPQDGYYWRDYNGKIPKDAFPGGINSKAMATYIGQVYVNGLVVPAKIDPGDNTVTYEWGYKEYVATTNIKIFCTQHPDRFEWIQTGNGLLQNLPQENLIIGGFEPNATIYIGRKSLEDELSVGKIISTHIQTTLNTTKGGKGYQHASFEILSYKPIGNKGLTNATTATNCTVVNNITINMYNK